MGAFDYEQYKKEILKNTLHTTDLEIMRKTVEHEFENKAKQRKSRRKSSKIDIQKLKNLHIQDRNQKLISEESKNKIQDKIDEGYESDGSSSNGSFEDSEVSEEEGSVTNVEIEHTH